MDISSTAWFNVISFFNIAIMVIKLVASIYAFVMFVKFTRLGIKAFSIYIEKNR